MTYAFFNFNTYLGGGETLIVRWAEFLKNEGYDFRIFYKSGSYIDKDLRRIGIDKFNLCPIESSIDYYYLNNKERTKLREKISGHLIDCKDVCLVSLNSRELYTLTDLAKNNPHYHIAHLILHNQDNLYVCQSVIDKIILKLGGKRRFSRNKQIEFNKQLFNVICNQSIVIPQSELQACLLKNEFDINTEKEKVVPLPTCDFSKYTFEKRENNHRIIWIGRIVDFKLPALYTMLNFISKRKDYTLTIIGDGALDKVKSYIEANNIPHDNITFLGKVDYENLGSVIKQHSIGYAMGTSIIEIGKYGLPVIMALGSPDFELFNSDICGGLYSHQSRGNVGDTLFYLKHNDPIELVDDTINEIELDYDNSALTCYETLKDNFDNKRDFSLYMHWLAKANPIMTNIRIPKASWLRRKLFYRF